MSTPVGLAATWIGAQSERGAQSLGRGHGLVRRLAVDVKDSSEGEDKIGTFI